MIRTGTRTVETPNSTMASTASAVRRTRKAELFSTNFHANHASQGDLDFDDDGDDSDEDFSWAKHQLFDEPNNKNENSSASGHLHRQFSERFTIKPKTKKIDNDDEHWFSEASDVEGPSRTMARTGRKKRRKPQPRAKASQLAQAPKTRGVQKKKSEDSMLSQTFPHKNGDYATADDDSSAEENLLSFSANFDGFGRTAAATTNNNPKALPTGTHHSMGDGSASSWKDSSTNHSSSVPALFPEPATTSTGPPDAAMHSSVSTSSTHTSPKDRASTSMSMGPVPPSPKGADKVEQAAPLLSDPFADDSWMDQPKGSNPEDWLGELETITIRHKRVVSASDALDTVSLTDTDYQMAVSSTSFSNSPSKKVMSSLAAAAALMNKPPTAADAMDPRSGHSTESSTNTRKNSMAYMQPAGNTKANVVKQRVKKKTVDALSVSDHGPRRHSMMGAGAAQSSKKVTRAVPRQRSATRLCESSNASLNVSALFPTSGSLNDNGSLQNSGSQSVSGFMNSSSDNMMNAKAGGPQKSMVTQKSNPNGNPQGKPRRKVVRGSVKGAGDTPSGNGEGGPRRRNPGRQHSISGSSDDGSPLTPAGNGIARRRIPNTSNSNSDLSSSMHGALGPVKKKVIRRRASDGGMTGDSTDDDAVSDNPGRVVKRKPPVKTKALTSGIAKISQVATAKQNMAKVQAELKRGPQRKLKTGGNGPAGIKPGGAKPGFKATGINPTASRTKTSLERAIQDSQVGPRRGLQAQSSVRSMPVQSAAEVASPRKLKTVSRADTTAEHANAHSSDELIVRQKPLKANTTALDQHMIKRRPKKPTGPSGSASLAGHEMQMKKKKLRQPNSDLSSLPTPQGASRLSGAASVAGDQVSRRPTGKRPVNRANSHSGDETLAQLRRKPGPPDRPRSRKIDQ